VNPENHSGSWLAGAIAAAVVIGFVVILLRAFALQLIWNYGVDSVANVGHLPFGAGVAISIGLAILLPNTISPVTVDRNE
jgi:hypothetical protein